MAKAAPSTMGTLTATGFLRGGKALESAEAIGTAEAAAFWRAFANGIAERGKAKVGDKTILDVLDPLARALEAQAEAGAPLGAGARGCGCERPSRRWRRRSRWSPSTARPPLSRRSRGAAGRRRHGWRVPDRHDAGRRAARRVSASRLHSAGRSIAGGVTGAMLPNTTSRRTSRVEQSAAARRSSTSAKKANAR